MKFLVITSVLAFTSFVAAQANGGPPFDPSGTKNVGNGKGTQFIGGQCLSTADCASGCCAGPSGICSGVGAQTQAGKTGCGFGGGSAPAAAPPAAAAPLPPAAAAPPAKAAGNAQGFVTEACSQDSDCQQGCCAFNTGKCAGPAIAQTRDGGCGFSSPKPNCNVAAALHLSDCVAGAVNGNLADPTIQAAAEFVSKLDGIAFTPQAGAPAAAAPPAAAPPAAAPAAGGAFKGGPAFDPSGAKNVGNGHGAQFIGGQCLSTADCASGCCAGPSGICSGVGAQTQAGKTGCGFVSRRMLSRRY